MLAKRVEMFTSPPAAAPRTHTLFNFMNKRNNKRETKVTLNIFCKLSTPDDSLSTRSRAASAMAKK